MPLHEIKIVCSDDELAFLKFQAVKLNMTIPSVIKKLIKTARDNQKKTIDLSKYKIRGK